MKKKHVYNTRWWRLFGFLVASLLIYYFGRQYWSPQTPNVVIENIANGDTLRKSPIVVTGTTSGVDAFELDVNGKKVECSVVEGEFSVKVELVDGDNIIVVPSGEKKNEVRVYLKK